MQCGRHYLLTILSGLTSLTGCDTAATVTDRHHNQHSVHRGLSLSPWRHTELTLDNFQTTRSVARFLCNNRASSWLFVVRCSSIRILEFIVVFLTRDTSLAPPLLLLLMRLMLHFCSSSLSACFISTFWHWTKCSAKMLFADVLAALLIVGCRKLVNEQK